MNPSLKRRTTPAPPPTPIATGRGIRSAAVDDIILTRYLETSLKIPDLILPPKFPAKINFDALVAGESDPVEKAMAAIKEMGAFLIDCEEAIEVGRELFEAREDEQDLGFVEVGVRPETYRIQIFREKVKKVTSKLEMVAESIAKVLSENIRYQNQGAKLQKVNSVIFFRKNGDSNIHHGPRYLSLHITGDDHKLRINYPDSTSFTLPTSSILVTIGKQFEEFSDGELKSFNGEIFLEPTDDRITPFSLEFMYSMAVLSHTPNNSSLKRLSILDQISILLILAFLYNLWS